MPLTYLGDTLGYRFTPNPATTNVPDVFGLGNPPQVGGYQSPLDKPRVEIYKTDDPDVLRWRLTFTDFRGGVNKQVGWSSQSMNELSYSSMDTRFAGHATLPFLVTEQTSPIPSYNTASRYLSSCNAFGYLVIAMYESGGVAGNYTGLYRETSSTDPTLTKLTYSKGSTHAIVGLSTVTINGVSYVAVLKKDEPPELLSDLGTTPTSLGSMHASTDKTFAMMNTILDGANDPSLLLVHDNSIEYLTRTDAYSTDPTLASYIPVGGGGFALGQASLGGGPVRCWWNFLAPNASGSQQQPGNSPRGLNSVDYQGAVYSTAQDGTDLQILRLPLRFVLQAVLVRDGLVATDGQRVIFTNGKTIRDLRIFQNRYNQHLVEYRVNGFWVKNNMDLYASVEGEDIFQGNSRWAEMYDWDLNGWLPASSPTAFENFTSSSVSTAAAHGSLPVSDQTGCLHTFNSNFSTGKWWRQFQAPAGVNPFNFRYSGGFGLTGNAAVEYAASGTLITPYLDIDDLVGMPKVVRRIVYLGDTDAGGTGGTAATVRVQCTGADTNSHTLGNFATGNPNETKERIFEDNETAFYQFQMTVTATRQSGGSSPTHYTPNVLPIMVEGFAFKRDLPLPAFRAEPDI